MVNKIKKYRYRLINTYFDSPLIFGNTRIWQIGRLYCAPNAIIPEHTHPDLFELTVVTSGKGHVYTNGVESQIAAGDIYFSFPRETHKIVSNDKAPLQYDFLAFTTVDAGLCSALGNIKNEFSDPTRRIFKSSTVASLLCDAILETENSDGYSDTMLKNIFEQILIHIVRGFSNNNFDSKKKSATDAEALCYQAMYYIDTHIFSMKILSEVADGMSYNYSYLSHLFKSTTGQTLAEYHRAKKLQVAKSHLSDGGSVTKIAELLGYSSVYAFSRAFKASYGVSPSTYKKRFSQSRNSMAKESP